jgi:predicted MFS family arabinose efflux permease
MNDLASPTVTESASAHPPLARATVYLMALTVAITVAGNYYAQPLLADIARSFGLSVTRVGAIAMVGQIGTALGMFLFVPLGDKFERRRLVTVLLLAATASLTLVALARNAAWLAAACFAVGATAATVHIVVPFAAHLASQPQRGRVIGTVLGGLLFGVLLARTFSGALGAYVGWRAVFGTAAVVMLCLAALVRARLPSDQPTIDLSWSQLMRSTWDLVIRHATLRESAILGALSFGAFSAFWTTLVFYLNSPTYGYGAAVAGMFGLAGAAGAAGAPLFGHLAGRHGPRRTIAAGLVIALIAFLLMGVAGGKLASLILGVVAMDLGVQMCHVSNQTRIYAIDPTARSRLNMVYMVCYFSGGAAGSYLGAVAWRWLGWWGVCGVGAAANLVAILVQAAFARK